MKNNKMEEVGIILIVILPLLVIYSGSFFLGFHSPLSSILPAFVNIDFYPTVQTEILTLVDFFILINSVLRGAFIRHRWPSVRQLRRHFAPTVYSIHCKKIIDKLNNAKQELC